MLRKRHFYNNGIREIFVYEGDVVPERFVKGRIPFTEATKERCREAKHNKVHMFKADIEIWVDIEDVERYLSEGYKRGRAPFTPQAIENIVNSRKEFFKNNLYWRNSSTWKKGNIPWNAGKEMSPETKHKLSISASSQETINKRKLTRQLKYGNPNFVNTEKRQKTIYSRYGEDAYKVFAEKGGLTRIRNAGSLQESYRRACQKVDYKKAVEKQFNTRIENYGTLEDSYLQAIQKRLETMRKNKSFGKSSAEEYLYEKLCEIFTLEDIVRQYRDIRYTRQDGYMYSCDLYIKSLDCFIEINMFPTHYKERFDKDNPQHIALLEKCENNPDTWIEEHMSEIWAKSDVEKCNCAQEKHLNYYTLYTWSDIYDFIGRISSKIKNG